MLLHDMIAGLALAWAAILVGGWFGWQLLRQNGRMLLQLEELEKRLNELEFGEDEESAGLAVGSEAPAFELPDLAGERKSLAQFRERPVLLIFFNPGCGFCRDLVPKLAELSPSPALEERVGETRPINSKPLILILSAGSAEANHQLFSEHPFTGTVLLQKQTEVSLAYEANGTPSGYLISAEGKIATGLTIGGEALLEIAAEPRSSRREEAHLSDFQPSTLNGHGEDRSLVTSAATNGDGVVRSSRFSNRSVVRSKIKRDGLKAGTPAPDFRLPRLDGRGELGLQDLRGQRVLLVFSSPHCGPCSTLAPELEKFHRASLGREVLIPSPLLEERVMGRRPFVQVVMITKGEPKENRAKVKEHGLTFPVLLQQQWEVSRRYAMFATPVAYVIDEAGVIAEQVAVGSDAILELMSRAKRTIRTNKEPTMSL